MKQATVTLERSKITLKGALAIEFTHLQANNPGAVVRLRGTAGDPVLDVYLEHNPITDKHEIILDRGVIKGHPVSETRMR